MMETVYVTPLNRLKQKDKDQKPSVITWNGVKLIRGQSLRATAREIVEYSQTIDVTKINFIGPSGSGKTTSAKCLMHIIHDLTNDLDFEIKILGKHDLAKFEETIKTLRTHTIILFDDVSYLRALISNHGLELIKQKVTELRHIPGGKDVRLILISNFHYSKAYDKFLRDAPFTFLTQVGPSETENVLNMVGKRNADKIKNFKRVYKTAHSGERKFTYRIGSDRIFSYEFQKPFIPLLFWNEFSLRNIVSPKREWMAPQCTTCKKGENPNQKSDIPAKDFVKDLVRTYGDTKTKLTIQVKLLQHGFNTFPKRTQQCMMAFDDFFKNNTMNFTELEEIFDLEVKKTRLDQDKRIVMQPKPKTASQIEGIFDFDVAELSKYAKPQIQRENWVKSFYNQNKQANLETYSLLQTLYKENQEPETARKIKALYYVIRTQK